MQQRQIKYGSTQYILPGRLDPGIFYFFLYGQATFKRAVHTIELTSE